MGYWGQGCGLSGLGNHKACEQKQGSIAKAILFIFCLFFALGQNPSHGGDKQSSQRSYNYTPERYAVPYPESIVFQQSWRKYIEFIYNRGPQGTSFLNKVLEIIDPRHIRQLPHYKNPSNTRITLMTYEFRSQEVRLQVENLLKQGFKVRIIVDSGSITPLQKPKARLWNSWTDKQKTSFLNSYDHDRDGTVSESDISYLNSQKSLIIETWKKLQTLQPQYSQQLELITSPHDIVPASDQYRYPRLHHFKKYSVDFIQDDGKWASEISLISSANLTDSCLDKRIYQGKINQQRYLEGEPYSLAKGSEGHIQFGAIIRGVAVNSVIDTIPEKWVEAYKKGRHFDSLELPPTLNPRLVFQDPKTGHTAVLQSFFSEGMTGALHRQASRDPVDPVNAITNILAQDNLHLKVYYSDQFVYAHTGLARHLRHQFARGGLEDMGIFVDGNFAVETYSALPEALFAPLINNRLAVLDGKAIQEMLPLPRELEWENKVYVFEGDRGVYGGPGDKLHSKHQYLEYMLDGHDQRHYTTAWGSGNQSNNAGKQNADALFILDTTDPALGNAIRPFLSALREEQRLRPYSEAYLERRFLEIFNQTRTDIFTEDFYKNFSNLLKSASNDSQTRSDYQKLLSKLKKAGPSLLNETSTAHGKNFLNILEWYGTYSQRPLNWVELYLCIALAMPSLHPQPGLLHDLLHRWLGPQPSSREQRRFYALANKLLRTGAALSIPNDPHYKAVIDHLCAGYLERLDVTIPGFLKSTAPRENKK